MKFDARHKVQTGLGGLGVDLNGRFSNHTTQHDIHGASDIYFPEELMDLTQNETRQFIGELKNLMR